MIHSKEEMRKILEGTRLEGPSLVHNSVPSEEEQPTMKNICPVDTFVLKEKLTNVRLIEYMKMLNEVYRGRRVKHKSGSIYFITGAVVINKDGKAWWGLEYSPFINGTIILEVRHTRTVEEFIDGRFTLV